ncbi:MAG TPA: aspartate--tRNA ligase [Bdellovibrionales bacterium]|nr:aspartate--tRNA ligase [Bdellovibrionales bacterium]
MSPQATPASRFVRELKRSHRCGDLRGNHQGEDVVLMGWVDSRRDHGGLVFVDLRDRSGICQVVFNPQDPLMLKSKDMRGEYVIGVRGKVRLRPQGMKNPKLATGDIEVEAVECDILSEAKPPPFQITDPNVSETTRLKYRYIDLRSPRLQEHLAIRHKFNQIVRKTLSEQNFLEIETPILYKSTPEGARDYLVPSRVNPGNFYALPQSPQTLKQLLMISGYDRYFQIARCFRDEDLRADRQPEFTQVDIEMSFADVDDVLKVNETLLRQVWKEIKGVELGPIPRMTYQEAMDRYGSDKPDIRFGLELVDLQSAFAGTGVRMFEDVIARKGAIKGFVVPNGAEFSRSQIDKLTDKAKENGGKGLMWIKHDKDGKWTSPVSKFLDEAKLAAAFKAAGAKQGDMVLIVSDDYDTTCAVLSALRLSLGRELNLIDHSKDFFVWIVDFPLFEYDKDNKRWAARHHPFTAPKDEHLEILLNGDESRYGEVLAKAYDLACNGHELLGGSIRIHRNEVQQAMFKALGLSKEETELKFGFFLEALTYGTPPHGGAAWGVDRAVMILCQTENIREVIAFPKTAKASDLMAGSPGPVNRDQLLELGIRLAVKEKEASKGGASEPAKA